MLLKLDHISYKVKKKKILHNISFSLKKYDFLTLTGPSGCGKSTILKLVASLISPTTGTIFYQDRDIAEIDPIQYRRKVSYCFQQPLLFGKTVNDNLSFPFEIRKQNMDMTRIDQLLRLVDLDHSYLDKKKEELSGGEKQRVALIRNLLFMPKILLLDEVTTGLDDQSKEIVHHLINDCHEKGTTILQVTHDQEELHSASKLMKMTKEGTLA